MRNFYEQVYEVVMRIPPGKVSSYGRISKMLGRPNAARAVGYALNALKSAKSGDRYSAKTVPWQRVVNSQGRITIRSRKATPSKQAALLRAEGVEVQDQFVNLDKHLWEGLHLVELDDIIKGDAGDEL